MLERRNFLKGLSLLVAAPALVKFDSLMPVKLFYPEIIKPIKVTRILQDLDDGRWYSWQAIPGNELCMLSHQKLDDRVAQFWQTASISERHIVLEIDGHTYTTTGSGKPLIPLDINSPKRRPLA